MRTLIRWTVGLIAFAHGLIHLMGVVKGFGWGSVAQLSEPISTSMGAAWLVAAVVVSAAGAPATAAHGSSTAFMPSMTGDIPVMPRWAWC